MVKSCAKPRGQGAVANTAARFLLDGRRIVETFRNGSTEPLWVTEASNAGAVELGIA
jgi:hypothetical protein